MEIQNMTPHAITLRVSRSKKIIIPKGNSIARVQFGNDYLGSFDGIPIHSRKALRLEGFPEKLKHDKIYIVSAMCQENMEEIGDYWIVSPDRLNCYMENSRIVETDRLIRIER